MSEWIPTSRLEFRKIKVQDGDKEVAVLALYQRWTMSNHHGEVKFQWRPVPGQGITAPQGPMIAEREIPGERMPDVFDPSD